MKPKTLAERMRGRAPPSPEAFTKAFGGTKSVVLTRERESNDDVTIEDAVVVTETEAAICFNNGAPKNFWIPKSVIVSHTKDAAGPLVVARWFAVKEGWS